MKKILKFSIFIAVLTIVISVISGCKKDDDNVKKSETGAKKEFDQSNYGIYKGVFVGSNGVITVNLCNNGNSPFATLIIDENTFNFTTIQTITQGTNSTVLFKKENSSFVFSVNADGTNSKITDINIEEYPNTQAIVAKEKSSAAVECYKGTYTGNAIGTFNAIIWDNQFMGMAYSSDYIEKYVCGGHVENSSISGIVVVGETLGSFEGKKTIKTISGTWKFLNSNGTWTGTQIE